MIIKVGTLPCSAAISAGTGVDMCSVLMAEESTALPVDTAIPVVATFSDALAQTVLTAVYRHAVAGVELRGDETPLYLSNLRRTIVPDIAPALTIFKVLPIADREDIARAKEYDGAATYCQLAPTATFLHDHTADMLWRLLDDEYAAGAPFLVELPAADARNIPSLPLFHPLFAGVHLVADDNDDEVAGAVKHLRDIASDKG